MSTDRQGQKCPHCEKGTLSIDSDREIYENPDNVEFGSHKTWWCNQCGHKVKDIVRGINETKSNKDKLS